MKRDSAIEEDLTSSESVDKPFVSDKLLADPDKFFLMPCLIFGDETGECFGFGDARGDRFGPSLSVDITLSKEAFRFRGGSALIGLLIGLTAPFPRGGRGAYQMQFINNIVI